MSVKIKIESLLFVSSKPLTVKRLAEVIGQKKEEVKIALDELMSDYDARKGGLMLLRNGQEVQMATVPDSSEMIKDFLKDEAFGELTRPSLEALTIVAYRGPITKAELEQIRGVNCSLILRNLMIRGLVDNQDEKYIITFDFLRHLGLRETTELPDFEKLNSDQNLQKILEAEDK